MADIRVIPVDTPRDRKRHLAFLYDHYKGDPHFAPQPRMAIRDQMNRKKNPFFLHTQAQEFLAERNGRVVGTISGIWNTQHNGHWGEQTGFFGFFECIDDQDVANALLAEAEAWCKAKGATRMLGPANYTSNDGWGMLLEGFDSHPVIMMPYNPEYYLKLVEGAGYAKAKDLVAMKVRKEELTHDRFKRVVERALTSGGLTLRSLNLKQKAVETAVFKKIYNEGWAENWGFCPVTDEEFIHFFKDLSMVADPYQAMVVEDGDKNPVGFAVNLPNFGEVFHQVPSGRLLPLLPRLIWAKLRGPTKHVKSVRTALLAVLPEYRQRGADVVLAYYCVVRAVERGALWAEISWILEDNHKMIKPVEKLGAHIYKRYRVFEKAL